MGLVDKEAKSVVWITPSPLVGALAEAVGGFDLDPCTEPDNPVGAREFFTEEDDGLAKPWHGVVWVNPPYGRGFQDWVRKIGDEAKRCSTIVALLPANRTETAYMHDLFAHPRLRALCYVRKRLRFLRPDGSNAGSNPYASALLVFGHITELLAEELLRLGVVFDGPAQRLLYEEATDGGRTT